MSQNMYALMLWTNDEMRTSVHHLKHIISPKKPWNEYKTGDIGTAKYPGVDFFRAKGYKGDWEFKILALGETRKELDPEVVTCIDKDKAKYDMTETTTEATTETTKDTITTTTEATTAVEDTTTIVTEEATTTEETTVTKKVKKPRAIKRRLDTSSESEAATFERASSQKDLKTTAENLALADLSSNRDSAFTRLKTPSKSNLVYSSLDLLNKTGLTPEKDPELKKLTKEYQDLSARNYNNEWSLQCAWNEITIMKQEIGSLKAHISLQTIQGVQVQQTSPPGCSPKTNLTMASPERAETSSSCETENFSIESPQFQSKEEEEDKVYNGFSKSQVLEILTTNAKYKKGLVAAFKLLFRQEEYEGHSLSGRKNKNGGQKPALADQRKWSFLEDCVAVHYSVPRDSIRTTIRDFLKPSRALCYKKTSL